MKKGFVLMFLVFVALPSLSFANEDWLRVQLRLQPSLYLGEDYSVGIEARAEADYRYSSNILIGLSVGYAGYFPTDNWEILYSMDSDGYRDQYYSFVPIMGHGYWFFSTERFRPFVGIGLGIALTNEYYEYREPYWDGYSWRTRWREVDVDHTCAIIEPIVGIESDLGKNLFFHGSLRYQWVIDESSQLSGAVGIGYKLY